MIEEKTRNRSLPLMMATLLGIFLFIGPSLATDADVHLRDLGPFAPSDDDRYPDFTISIEDTQPGETYEAEITIDEPDGRHSCTVDLKTDGVVRNKNCDGYTLEVSAFEFCWGYHDNDCAQDGLIAWKLPVCQKGGEYTVSILIKNGVEHAKEDFDFDILDPTDPRCWPPEPICDDGFDNDRDGLVDCDDPDCCGDPACFRFFGRDEGAAGPNGKPGTCCGDGVDNDNDGDPDGLDIDCHEHILIDCDDGIDNDGDGKKDCADPDCGKDPACLPEDCGDGECKGEENCQNCVADCGECPPSECGDGSCDGDETCESCEQDCGACLGPPGCPSGTCEYGETCVSCPSDCGECAATCGDGACTLDETCVSCPQECGECEVPGPEPGGDGTMIGRNPDIVVLTKDPKEYQEDLNVILIFEKDGIPVTSGIIHAWSAESEKVLLLPMEPYLDPERGEVGMVTIPAEEVQKGVWTFTYVDPEDPTKLDTDSVVVAETRTSIKPPIGELQPHIGGSSSETSALDQALPFIGILLLILIAIGLFYARKKGKELVAVKDEDSLEKSGEVEEV